MASTTSMRQDVVDEYAVKRQNRAGGVIQRLSMMLAALTRAVPGGHSLVVGESTRRTSSKAYKVGPETRRGVYQAELNASINAKGTDMLGLVAVKDAVCTVGGVVEDMHCLKIQ